MNKKLKYYFIGISFISMITCASIIPLHTSYGDNAVEQESSVSYEMVDNRGLKEIKQEEEMEIMSFSISSYSVGEPIIGITKSLSTVDSEDVEKLVDNNYMWTTDRVNLRLEASTNSDIVTKVEKRAKIQMISSSNKWTKVKYKDKEGYIYSTYLRDTELPSLDFTDEEIDLLAKIVWLESRGELDDGVAATVIVIINRILSIEFSDTLYKVLSDKGEFSSWKLLNTAKPDERIYEIIGETLNGLWDGILTEDHVYFSTKPRNNNGTIKIGNHYFCKIKDVIN